MTKKQKKNVLLSIICIGFLLQPIILPTRPTNVTEAGYYKELSYNMLGNVLILLFFYINYSFLIPKLLFPKKYVQYCVIIIIGLGLILFLPYLIVGPHTPPPPSFRENPNIHIPESFFRKFQLFFSEVDHLVFLFAGSIFFSTFWREKLQNQKIKTEKLQTELSHLKLQIHPHFLFNTLNSIYASAIKKEEETANTVLILADFMRYLLQDSYQDEVLLEKEIHYITNYVELQKTRLRNSIAIDFKTNGDFSNKKISPLILFTFIENAFKYGVNPDEKSEIEINITLNDYELDLLVFNRIVSTKNIESSNIGIKNTKDRLALFYPQKHSLSITEKNETFTVKLKMILK
ncbi:histidine kinase [Flavobacterium sp. SUN046]|uniref:sensor histidine kinase n=1 Tax=Flavobacterium sp. SUN046 TaxID=3002440 RepID=UPI002DBD97B9|nr:histidine kinase [Flavobacterium sp. SUN046]MEC4048683.1 histidine kinase [Flavobacterium sp. SUN046]